MNELPKIEDCNIIDTSGHVPEGPPESWLAMPLHARVWTWLRNWWQRITYDAILFNYRSGYRAIGHKPPRWLRLQLWRDRYDAWRHAPCVADEGEPH